MKVGRWKTLVVVAVTITAGCASTLDSAPNSSVETSEALSTPPSWTPPNDHPIGTLTPVSPGKTIDPKSALSALSDPNVRAELRGYGSKAASNAGVASPKTMNVVAAADHQEAETILSGATINDHAPVYVITITGGPFTSRMHRANVSAPQGNVLTLTIDAATHRLTDVGFVDAAPDLSSLGSPVDLM